MNSKFLDNFYDSLFETSSAFDRFIEEKPLRHSFAIVVMVSILSVLLSYTQHIHIKDLLWVGYNLVFAAIAGIISWLFFASFIELIASIFNQNGKMKVLLCLTGFALIPWLFIAPIELLKNTGEFGNLIAILMGLFVWLWVTVLEITAIMKTYGLTFGKAILLVIIPFLGGFLSFHWFIGFFATLARIVKL